MIHSMTGYGVATRQAAFTDHSGAPCDNVATVSVEFRTVNSRFLDLLFRAPEECRAFEPALREMLMSALSRGKLECRINLQRQEAAGDVAALNVGVLQQLATLEQEVARHLPAAGSLRMGEVLRWPGVLAEPELTQDALREAVTAAAKEALQQLLESRRREGEALKAMLLERVDAMLSIVEDLVPMVPNLIQQHQDKLTERLREAFGLAAPDGTRRSRATSSPSASARKPPSTASASTSPRSSPGCRRTCARRATSWRRAARSASGSTS